MARVALVSLFDEYALGNRQVAASLLDAGHDARLFFLRLISFIRDVPMDPADTERVPGTLLVATEREIEILSEEIGVYGPDVVGISLTSNLYGLGIEVSRRLRKHLNVPIVWGGIEPTINPDLAEEHADVICVGEGERPMVELANRMDERGRGGMGGPLGALESLDGPIDNLKIRRNGGWMSGRLGVITEDLDSLPFALFDPERETYIVENEVCRGEYPPACRVPRTIPVMSYRGCPYQCSYCCHSVLKNVYTGGRYLRRRSVDHFIAELCQRKAQFPEVGVFEIEDDVFTLDQKWIDRFCEEYKRKVKKPFWCYTYPGISKESMLVPLREAGLYSVTFGIQTGSQRVLREVFERPVNVEDVNRTANILRRLGIDFVVDIIGSNPFETDVDRIETVRVLTELPKPYVLHPIGALMFYNRFRLTERARDEGAPLFLAPGTTKYAAEPSPRYRAWDAIMMLAHFPGIDFSTLVHFWENDELMNNPEPLEQLAKAFRRAAYDEGDVYMTKEQRIQREQERAACVEGEAERLRSELASLRGSRLIRLALLARGALGRPG